MTSLPSKIVQALHPITDTIKNAPMVCAFLASILLFICFPRLDVWVSGLFYTPEHSFYLSETFVVESMHWVFGKIQYFILLGLVVLLFMSREWLLKHTGLYRKHLWFLLLLLLLGPGLLVNIGLKDNSTGRARPNDTALFGGDKQYTMPFVMAEQCGNNCSFVSGHASTGFFLMGLAWVFQRRRLLVLGVGLGAIAGFGRILQGGHFLSDVIFSFWTVYFATIMLAHWFDLSIEKRIYVYAEPEGSEESINR